MSVQTTPTRAILEVTAMRSLRPLLLAVLLLAATSLLGAQAYTPPPPPLTSAPCVSTRKNPCTPAPNAAPPATSSDKFPFPGEDPGSAAPNPVPEPSTKPPASDSAARPSGTADKFPFPGEDSAPPASSSSSSAAPASPGSQFPFPGEPAEDPSAPSSDSRSPASPAGPRLKDAGSSGSTASSRRRLAKVEDVNEREAKDLDVSHFYLTAGNYVGAYNRAKDALNLFPDDAEAHYAVAAAAEKLKKKDEAVAEYKSYLNLEPDGDHVKAARKALTDLH